MSYSRALLEAIESKDPVRISEAFEQAMKPKCVSIISEMKTNLVKGIFEGYDDYEDDDDESEYLEDYSQDDLHKAHKYKLDLENIEVDNESVADNIKTVIINAIGTRGTSEYISGSEAQSQFQKAVNALNMAGLEEYICCVAVEEIE